MATLRDELNELFERFNEFTRLGDRFGFAEDIARVPKLFLAKQITDAFQPKADPEEKKQDLDDWLVEHLEVTAATKDEKFPDWEGFLNFKDQYTNLMRTVLRDVGRLGRDQLWIDPDQIADGFNAVDLRGMWVDKENGKVKAALAKALAKTLAGMLR